MCMMLFMLMVQAVIQRSILNIHFIQKNIQRVITILQKKIQDDAMVCGILRRQAPALHVDLVMMTLNPLRENIGFGLKKELIWG